MRTVIFRFKRVLIRKLQLERLERLAFSIDLIDLNFGDSWWGAGDDGGIGQQRVQHRTGGGLQQCSRGTPDAMGLDRRPAAKVAGRKRDQGMVLLTDKMEQGKVVKRQRIFLN